MRILLTGASGFIGSHILAELNKNKKYKIRVLVKDGAYSILNSADIFHGNLFDDNSLSKVCRNIDLIIHVAGGGQLNEDYRKLFKLNVQGTENLINAAKRNNVKKIIYISSCSVIAGNRNRSLLNEDSAYSPFNNYGKSKVEAELLVKKSGLYFVIVRPTLVYGPNLIRCNINNSGLAQISKMIDLIYRNKFVIPGHGNNKIHLTYINNLTQAIIKIIEKWPKNNTFIIADNKPITLNHLVSIINSELNKGNNLRHAPIFVTKLYLSLKLIKNFLKNKKTKINKHMINFISGERFYSISEAKDVLKFNPTSTEVGLSNTINWLKNNLLEKNPTLTFQEGASIMKRKFRFILAKIYEKIIRNDTKFVYFDITHKCNLKCPHCYYYRNNHVYRDKPFSYWKKFFSEYRQKGYLQAAIAGGEPALRMDILKLANNIFPILTIFSNGTIKIDESIKQRIFISLDGHKELHDLIRGKGVFDKIYKNYKNDKRVILRIAITSMNYKYINDFVRIAKNMNVRGVGFVLYSKDFNDGSNLDLNQEQLSVIRTDILNLLKENPKFVFLTRKMLDSMIKGDFVNECGMRKSPSFFPDGSIKKCALHNVDCNGCRCSTAALMHTYNKDFETFLLACKFGCG